LALKPPAFLKWSSNPLIFWSFAAWISFVFVLFFLRLYPSLDAFILGFISTSNLMDSTKSADFGQRLSVWKDSFLNLATGALLMGILWSCGKRLFGWLLLEAPQPIRFCMEIGLGISLLNGLWMGLGLARLWMESLWLIGFIFLAVLFLTDLLNVRRQGITLHFPRGLNFWLFLICAFYMAFLFLHSLLPETFYDSLNYFLGMPAFWLWNHGICDYPTHLLSGYFHGGSLFFMNGYVLAGTEGAKILAALVLFWIVLFCYGWARQWSGPRAGMVAATTAITFPLLYLNSWAVRVDGLLTFVLLLFFYALEKGVTNKKRNWIMIAGIFAGLALSIKPTAVVALVAALLALLWRDGFGVLKKKGWVIFSAIQAFEVGPWLLKNACFAGNAFFPYAISWMGGRSFPAWSQERLLHENQQFLPMDHGMGSFLTLPWRLTIPGAGDDQFIGPMLLGFLPLLFFIRFKDPSLKFLGRVLLLSFAFGLTLSHMLRFSIPAFVLSFLILSAVLGSLKDHRWKTLWVGAVVAIALMCVPEYLLLSATRYEGWGVWSGLESRQEYMARKMGPMSEWVNQNLPNDARLLVVGDAQVLYYKRPTYASSVFDEQFFAAAARKAKGPDGILRSLKELGINYIVVVETLGARNSHEYHQYDLNINQWRNINDFVQKGLAPVEACPYMGLYKVREELLKIGLRKTNPFRFFSPQAFDFFNDFYNKDYAKAKIELDELLNFFPGEDFWLYEKKELMKKIK
jgi:hypothetical protein